MMNKRQYTMMLSLAITMMALVACAPLKGQASQVENTAVPARSALEAQWMAATQATPLPFREIRLSEPQELVIDSLKQDSWDWFSQLHFAGNWIVGYAQKDSLTAPLALKEDTRLVVAIDPNTGDIRELSDKSGGSLAASERYVVWSDCYQVEQQYIGDLYVYDLHADTILQLPTDNNCPDDASIAGDFVVWHMMGPLELAFDVWGSNLTTGSVFPITELPGFQHRPKTDGEWVIYMETETDQKLPHPRNIGRHLYAYHIADETTVMLGDVWYIEEGVVYPYYDINTGLAAWITPDSQIHTYDLNTQNEQVLPELPNHCHPYDLKMSDGFLAFGCGQYMGYDLNSKQFFSIPRVPPTPASYSAERPNFSGNRLVWVVNLDNVPHIYIAEIVR